MRLAERILQEVALAKTDKPINKCIVTRSNIVNTNEFLFIIKPEIFARISSEQSKEALNVILDQIAAFDISIDKVRVINAEYLKKYDVIAHHYGLINAASNDFKSIVTAEIESNFRAIYGKSISDVSVFGSLEITNFENKITPEVLSDLWGSVKVERLAGGVYCGKCNYNNQELYIINGFHPPQIEHFVNVDSVIVTMDLSTNVGWKKCRRKFVGKTYPEEAREGSLRKVLFDKYGKFGFDEVSYVINSVHLSAGPVEGLVELLRFNTELHTDVTPSEDDYFFGRQLNDTFSPVVVERIKNNAKVWYKGDESNVFDVTEEKSSDLAIDILKEVRFNKK